MNLRKSLSLPGLLAAACVAPCAAQVYWSNQSPAGITDDIGCVAYANGTFAAVTSRGNVLTSGDGLNWSSHAVAAGTRLESIVYGSGTWVVVGDNGTILISSDLRAWVSAMSSTSYNLNGVIYDGAAVTPFFVAVGDGATIFTSPDAAHWNNQPAPAGVTGSLRGIALSSDFLLAPIGIYAPTVFISGALAGTGPGPGVLLQLSSVPASGSQDYTVAAVTLEVAGSNNLLLPPSSIGSLEAVLSVYDIFVEPNLTTVAVGWGGTIISGSVTDVDGSYFVPSAVPDVVYRGLTYGNGYYVAAGEQGTILSSTDGLHWTQRLAGDSPSTLSTSTLLSAAWSGPLARFVVTGAGGTILVSNSTPPVFANVSTRGTVSSTQTFIGGFVIEGTAPRTVLVRADGPVLDAFSVPNPLPDPVLTVYDSSGAVVATNSGWATNTSPTTISIAGLEVGAFALPNLGPDSALLLTLQPGAYTAQITSAKGNSGIALFEAYTD